MRRVSYHQSVFDLLDLQPRESPQARLYSVGRFRLLGPDDRVIGTEGSPPVQRQLTSSPGPG
jgi:hypothetical protein